MKRHSTQVGGDMENWDFGPVGGMRTGADGRPSKKIETEWTMSHSHPPAG